MKLTRHFGKTTIAVLLMMLFAGSGWLAAQMEEGTNEADMELIETGRMLFEFSEANDGVGCLNCHGTFGVGDLGIGPNVRGASEEEIRIALENVAQMDFLTLSDEQIEALSAYMTWLGSFFPAKTELRDEGFEPNELTVPAGAQVQLILDNRERRSAHRIASEDLAIEDTEIPARNADDFLWTAPEEEGIFTVQCLDCDEGTAPLTMKVEVQEEE